MESASINRKFAEDILNIDYLLDNAEDWIKDNLEPNDIFTKEQLSDWAFANGFIEEEE